MKEFAMTPVRLMGTATLAAAALGFSAQAAPLFVKGSRYVDTGYLGYGTSNVVATGQGAFDNSVSADLSGLPPNYLDNVTGEAAQHSVVDLAAGSIGGTGSARITGPADAGTQSFATSLIELWFDLSDVTTYSLSGMLNSVLNEGNQGNAIALVMLEHLGGDVVFKDWVDGGDLALNESGKLSAGSYHFWAFADMDFGFSPYIGGKAAYDFNFQLGSGGAEPATLPEAGSGALVAAALLAFALTRKRTGTAERRQACRK